MCVCVCAINDGSICSYPKNAIVIDFKRLLKQKAGRTSLKKSRFKIPYKTCRIFIMTTLIYKIETC